MTVPITSPELLFDLLDAAAMTWPDRRAISEADAHLTFGELASASHGVADLLVERGVRPGARVVIGAVGGVRTAAAFWGTVRAGAVAVVLHEQTRGAALEHVLDDSAPTLLVTDDPAAAAAATTRGVGLLTSSALDVVSRGPQAGHVRARPLAVDPACMIYTSGSTAAPKAVVSTHAAMVFAARAIQSTLRYTADDVVYCPLPLSFDYGLYQLFLGVTSGASVRLGTPAEVGPALLRNLVAARATVLAAVPAVAEALSRLLRRADARQVATLRLRLLTNTGAAMPPSVLAGLRERLPDLRVQLMFGLTECKRATIMPPDGDLVRPGSCGRALPGTAVLVVDDDGTPLPAGEVGQIVVRGPHVMAGYWRRPELTAERFFRRDGLFPELRTGDYGRLDADGYLYFDGRRDDLYKERGFRVSATEVEAAAMRVSGIEAVAVLPPAADRPATMIAATTLSAEQVVAAMRAQIEEYKIPRALRIVAALPLSGNGKIDRRALAQSLAGGAR